MVKNHSSSLYLHSVYALVSVIWPFTALRKEMSALPCCFCGRVYWSLDLMVHLSLEIFFKTFAVFYLLKRSYSSVWEDFSTRVSGLGIRNLDLSPASDILFKLPTLSLSFPFTDVEFKLHEKFWGGSSWGSSTPISYILRTCLWSSRIHCWPVWPLASGSLCPFPSSSTVIFSLPPHRGCHPHSLRQHPQEGGSPWSPSVNKTPQIIAFC